MKAEPNAESVKKWIEDRGDKTLRMNYDLNPNSLILDIGCYEGNWIGAMCDRYGCSAIAFEPVHESFVKARKFLYGKKVEVINSAFSTIDGTRLIEIKGDASSFVGRQNGKVSTVFSINGARYVKQLQSDIDLMKINIEGDEYDLLEEMIKENVTYRITNLQIQFHWDGIPDYPKKIEKIRMGLRKTHKQTWNYELVWENWRLKEKA